MDIAKIRISRVQKQIFLFDFAEREYLRRSAKDTNKSSAKANLFAFADKKLIRPRDFT